MYLPERAHLAHQEPHIVLSAILVRVGQETGVDVPTVAIRVSSRASLGIAAKFVAIRCKNIGEWLRTFRTDAVEADAARVDSARQNPREAWEYLASSTHMFDFSPLV